MKVGNRLPLFISLGICFLILGFYHLVAWLFVVFVYHGNAIPQVARTYLPVYGLLGTTGVWIFFLTIVLDFAAAVLLLTSRRRWRMVVFLAAIANLPVIFLGSAIGAAALIFLRSRWRERG